MRVWEERLTAQRGDTGKPPTGRCRPTYSVVVCSSGSCCGDKLHVLQRALPSIAVPRVAARRHIFVALSRATTHSQRSRTRYAPSCWATVACPWQRSPSCSKHAPSCWRPSSRALGSAAPHAQGAHRQVGGRRRAPLAAQSHMLKVRKPGVTFLQRRRALPPCFASRHIHRRRMQSRTAYRRHLQINMPQCLNSGHCMLSKRKVRYNCAQLEQWVVFACDRLQQH